MKLTRILLISLVVFGTWACDDDSSENNNNNNTNVTCEGDAPLANVQDGVCVGSLKVCENGQWVEPDYSTIEGHEATEVTCDGLDNNCDGQVDEGLLNTFYADADDDGYGDPESEVEACSLPEGYVTNSDDCNDENEFVNPDAVELCDGADNDCDGVVDAGICDENAVCSDSEGQAQCVCNDGFTGDGLNCIDVDECAEGTHDCNANAICTNIDGGFTCACAPGYEGDGVTSCTDIDECTTGTAACDANSTCTNTDGSYTCSCNPGYNWDGTVCADINECAGFTDNCNVNATCTNTDGGFICTCNSGYTGDGVNCSDVDECATGTANCDANATCTNTVGSYTCSCNPGYLWDGTSCADINECTTGAANCNANATCTNTPGSFSCACNSGYSGDGVTCSDVDECTAGTANCSANATCTNTVGSFSCACNTGYSGDGVTCSDVDECTAGTANCHANATCTNTAGSFSCACNSGYSGDGVTCSDVDECTAGTANCHANATCTNTVGSFSCACNSGYSGDGVTCSDVDECTAGTANCHANATCTNTAGSFSCACNSGYSGDGVTCSDVDECTAGTANCSANATCTNTVGSFSCACNSGYSGDGVTCSDVDECTAGTDNCHANATCTNTAGSFSCACNSGYSGDGVTCSDVDECTAGTANCSANATCTNTAGSFSCACNSGYSGDGVTCSDVDECTAGTANCSANATCTNTVGSFSCACNSGYSGDGVTCSDVDECTAGTHTCDANATCSNTEGSYTCACNATYTGDGYTCSPVMGQTCEQIHADYPSWPSGVYTIDPDGDGSGSDIYEVYCNMDVDGGGWTRVVKTTGQSHNWGQNNASIVDSWAGAEDIDGVYDAFDLRKGFNQVMILKTSGNTEVGNYASFNLVSGVSSRSIMDILTQDCQPATEYYGDDAAHDGTRVARPVSVNPAGAWTSEYSGLVTGGSNLTLMNTSGTLVPVSHFFMCGVNESSDNDQSVLAFSDSTGSSNSWGDSWRGDGQAGTIWSFWNGDYHTSGAYHIGKGYGNAFAGYKNYGTSDIHHIGTYEIYVRGCDFLTSDGRCVNDEVFTVTDYSTNNCISVDHEANSGDDRGGIAANSSYFLYNGDSNMMRTDTSLGSRTSLTRRDGVFSDLRSGQFYILWNTATGGPINHDIPQYTIDSVATYDPVTEAVGTPVPFGQSITFANTNMNGVYAGYGFAILYNDADHNWYILHPEFGSLTLLNNAPRHPNASGCENFATWGVATFDGTSYKIDVITNAPAVERFNVSTGTVEGPVNSFSNLGQMCAFTMVPGLNKWVGHHEYSSQIGTGNEVMFSCDVTWSN